MTDRPRRRGVTRGYVGGLIAASCVLAVALTVAAWGVLGLALDRSPVGGESGSEAPGYLAPLIVLVALALLAWGLWLEALVLLRGRTSPAWGHIVSVALGAYLVWSLLGILAGLTVTETLLSPFALWLVVAWLICQVLCWAVLARRVYTDRAAPKWPWERDEEVE